MTFKVIRGQGQGQEMTSVPFRDYILCMLAHTRRSKGFVLVLLPVTIGDALLVFRSVSTLGSEPGKVTVTGW